ncbi:MAG: hypothetical protein CVV47_08045 [Spirochaetae bacterium HGW-Spirochaetae-3]|nr:MAG: hypothetical protein CVV47_08045 [Spirochaetae bacterium HGW-Spirochaetae-3]
MAARFARERTFAYSRRVWLGDGWAAEERFYAEPGADGPHCDGPLIVLVSRETTSAAEVLAMDLEAARQGRDPGLDAAVTLRSSFGKYALAALIADFTIPPCGLRAYGL